jgi:ABC-2 type transport system permease protein
MEQFVATVRQELLCAKRERLPQVLLAIFLAMVAVSCFIGWATNHTVTNVYNEAVRQGITTAQNPFTGVSRLFYARNTVIYIVLIGALLAIVLGVQAALRDRKAKVNDLLLSRPVSTPVYLGAKLTGLCLWLLAILAVSAFINWLSISAIISHALSLQDSVRLLLFYAVAWLFLVPFVTLGLLSGLYARRETSALLIPIVIWSVLTFVIPQLGTAEHPVSLLNPVPAQIVSHGFFFQVNQTVFGPLSLTEHFKHVSGVILQDSQVRGSSLKSQLVVGSFAVVSVAALLGTKRTRLRNELNE